MREPTTKYLEERRRILCAVVVAKSPSERQTSPLLLAHFSDCYYLFVFVVYDTWIVMWIYKLLLTLSVLSYSGKFDRDFPFVCVCVCRDARPGKMIKSSSSMTGSIWMYFSR